jgi:hypothetical protein
LADQPIKSREELRARQAADGKKAMAEYEANAAAVRAKTEKLRALRLAREAEQKAAAPAAPKKKTAKASKTKKEPAGKLSDWLDEQAKTGRSV